MDGMCFTGWSIPNKVHKNELNANTRAIHLTNQVVIGSQGQIGHPQDNTFGVDQRI